MEYNYSDIGERIKKLRKQRGWSQDQLIEILGTKSSIGRNTLSAIENGNAKHFELSLLTAMCEVFECEMSYLLCEHGDCKTKDLQFIHDMTGLSESSIQFLSTIKALPEMSHVIALLDDLILDRDGDGINTLTQIAGTAHAIMSLRNAIPLGSLQANINFAGLNWTCQNSFMQFIERHTKT